MKPRATFLCGVLLLLVAGPLLASQAERQQIAAARQSIASDFAAQEQACRQRFAVTDCVEDVRVRRRQALAPWREKELALDAADRQRRADERRAAIQAKAQAASAASAPAVVPRARKPPPTPTTALPLAPPSADPALAAAAAARVKDAAQRKTEAETAQARVARRQAERSREGKAVRPLPVPAVGAASAAR